MRPPALAADRRVGTAYPMSGVLATLERPALRSTTGFEDVARTLRVARPRRLGVGLAGDHGWTSSSRDHALAAAGLGRARGDRRWPTTADVETWSRPQPFALSLVGASPVDRRGTPASSRSCSAAPRTSPAGSATSTSVPRRAAAARASWARSPAPGSSRSVVRDSVHARGGPRRAGASSSGRRPRQIDLERLERRFEHRGLRPARATRSAGQPVDPHVGVALDAQVVQRPPLPLSRCTRRRRPGRPARAPRAGSGALSGPRDAGQAVLLLEALLRPRSWSGPKTAVTRKTTARMADGRGPG